MIPAQLTPVDVRMLTSRSASRGLTEKQICDEGENGNQPGNVGQGPMTTLLPAPQ
jgi:hypothetical protein